MEFIITKTSQHALHLLSGSSHGKVHSVYRKTINLSLDGKLVSLQASNSPLSPISLITTLTKEEMSSLFIKANDLVIIDSGSIQINKQYFFKLEHAFSANLKLSQSLNPTQLPLLEQQLLSILAVHDIGSFELLFAKSKQIDEIPFLTVAQNHLHNALNELALSDWEGSAKTLCRLIGLGIGLTPGGDDFLCGILAGLILCNKTNHPFTIALHTQIRKRLTDTNEISAAFLQCGLEGQFSQAVNSLIHALSCQQILSSFSSIGHSSGMDTLCGIAFLLQNHYLL